MPTWRRRKNRLSMILRRLETARLNETDPLSASIHLLIPLRIKSGARFGDRRQVVVALGQEHGGNFAERQAVGLKPVSRLLADRFLEGQAGERNGPVLFGQAIAAETQLHNQSQ